MGGERASAAAATIRPVSGWATLTTPAPTTTARAQRLTTRPRRAVPSAPPSRAASVGAQGSGERAGGAALGVVQARGPGSIEGGTLVVPRAMDATDLCFAGAAEQARLVAAGEVSARELVDATLARIEALWTPQLNAFRSCFAERALAEADQADARRGAGEERPLLGVPVAIKDDVDVAGRGRRRGDRGARSAARARRRGRAPRCAAAGAIVVGKTHVPELTMLPASPRRSTFGATRNPWDRSTTRRAARAAAPAAAVAAGLCGVALGSDGGGSIRIPAAWCGLFGLKPQRDRVSLAPTPTSGTGLGGQRAAGPPGRRRRALPRRGRGGRRLRRGGRARARAPARRGLDRSRRARWRGSGAEERDAVERTARAPAPLGHDVVERELDYARRRRGEPAGALPARDPRRRRGGRRTPSASRPRTRAMARARRRSCRRAWCAGRAPPSPSSARGSTRAVDDVDVLAHARAGRGRRSASASSMGGARCGRSGGAARRAVLRRLQRHRPARDHRCPPASTTTACRSACSSSGAPATRRRCCRSPPSSRPARRGRDRGRCCERPRTLLDVAVDGRARGGRGAAASATRHGARDVADEVVGDRPGVRGRHRGRARDPRAARRAAARRRDRGGGGRRHRRARRACAGSSTRSTAPSTTSSASRSGPCRSPARATSASCSTRCATSSSPCGRTGRRSSTACRCAGRRRDDLATALVATGFGYDARRARGAGRGRRRGCCRRCATSAAPGSAALDLAWLAAGRYDAYYEHGVNAWDVAAGRDAVQRAPASRSATSRPAGRPARGSSSRRPGSSASWRRSSADDGARAQADGAHGPGASPAHVAQRQRLAADPAVRPARSRVAGELEPGDAAGVAVRARDRRCRDRAR